MVISERGEKDEMVKAPNFISMQELLKASGFNVSIFIERSLPCFAHPVLRLFCAERVPVEYFFRSDM